MKLKSFHWTRRTVVYALIGQAVLLALAVIWRSNGGVLSAHYNVTTTDGRIAYLQALGWEADPATETAPVSARYLSRRIMRAPPLRPLDVL